MEARVVGHFACGAGWQRLLKNRMEGWMNVFQQPLACCVPICIGAGCAVTNRAQDAILPRILN
jgi:hypothetical protein